MGVDYEHRVTRGLAAYANGWVGAGWGSERGLNYEAVTGLRVRW